MRRCRRRKWPWYERHGLVVGIALVAAAQGIIPGWALFAVVVVMFILGLRHF